MKHTRLRLALILCVLQPGCFYYYGAKNLIEAPLDARDECLMRCRFKCMAEEAWEQAVREDPSLADHFHYGAGFREGFATYLEEDGTGQPPAAPWIYRSAGFETPQGQDDIRDWYAGYRYGAQVARSTGYRNAAVIFPLPLPPAYTNTPPPPAPTPPPAAPHAADELLPPPHKAPGPPGDGKDGERTPP
jgi:hypothetical protein